MDKLGVIASIIAQAIGQKFKDVETLPAQGILIIISSSFLIILLTFFNSENLFKFYNASGDLLQFSVDYFNIRFGASVHFTNYWNIWNIQGLQNTLPNDNCHHWNTIKYYIDIIFVYGIDGFISPMYIKGAAYASLIAQITMAIIAVILLYKNQYYT